MEFYFYIPLKIYSKGEKKKMNEIDMNIHYDERENTSISPLKDVTKAICLVSGGMDSAVCLFHAVKELGAKNVKALSIHYGQKGSIELEHARRECASLGVERYEMDLSDIFKFNKDYSSYIKGSSKEIESKEYAEVIREKLSEGKAPISPEYIPARNPLLLNVAASIGLQLFNNEKFAILQGIHSDDVMRDSVGNSSAVYPDCSPEFANAYNKMIQYATAGLVYIYTPLAGKTKAQVAEFGVENGMTKQDFKNTWSCYSGANHYDAKEGENDQKVGNKYLCPTCNDKLRALIKGAHYTVEDVLDQFDVPREYAEEKVQEYGR